jgi:uncharacterized protein YpmB
MNNDPLSPLRKEVREIQDRHPELSPDNAFVVWFLRAFIVDEESNALAAIGGGARDKGVDALHIDHDNRLVSVVQGKYRQNANAGTESRSDVLALANLGRVLAKKERQEFKALLGDADPAVEGRLEKAREAIQKRGYRLVLDFVTTGKVSSTHREEAVQCLDDWDLVSFEVHDRSELIRRMQDYVEGAAPPVPTISLPIHGEQSFNRFDQQTRISSWVFTILGADLAKIFKENGTRLFQRNIRGYLGKNDINRGIERTIEREPEYFWYFNNGVTIVCDEARQIIDKQRKLLRVSNAQIINGQQTTRTLAGTTGKTATVLVKVIAVPRETADDQRRYSHLVSEIVSATNRQNAIGQVDLKSNDLEQIRLERDLKKLGYRYIRKRQSKGETRRADPKKYKAFIKKEELARAVGACLLDPFEVRLGVNRLFEDDLYGKIFDGRPAIDYLTFYRLFRIVSYAARGDIRLGYAKWLVLNFLWDAVGTELRRHSRQASFLYATEREYSHWAILQPLYKALGQIYKGAMTFYQANKKTKEGSLLDPSTFFKYRGRHSQFEKFWESAKNSRRRTVDGHLRKFIDALTEVDVRGV